ncbi:hypothetical protein [Rhodoferax sp. GW822-FHT02A01]|uniref:hypothetical protein n=1 Tax=Rhodoferax sp. GW822-FHT02A01 TaxID=3141537 RepID=UPI00315D2EE7
MASEIYVVLSDSPPEGDTSVASEGVAEDDDLREWVRACHAFVGNIPMKEPKVRDNPKLNAKSSNASDTMPGAVTNKKAVS